jgi:hypothetical protein
MCKFSGEDAEAGGDVSLPIPRQAVTHCSEWPKIRWFLDDFLCGAF